MTTTDPLGSEFLDKLVSAGLLIPTGIAGVFGRNYVFEDVVERFGSYITDFGRADNPEVICFPPVISRKDFERSGYLKSFPHLAGSIFSFGGTPEDHIKMLDLIHDGQDWSEYQTMTEVVVTPAACYPVYPMAAARGPIPKAGSLFDVLSYSFRHEPSDDPARSQIFRIREFVLISTPVAIMPWRDSWLQRGQEMMRNVGLAVSVDLAHDPFFGRGGRMLAMDQREQQLKFEILIPISSEEKPTAIMSVNYHQDHFAASFGLQIVSGEMAHTACVGFGMERIALALFKTHGMDPKRWPASIRKILWK